MLNKILLVCLLFSAGSSLTCKWMDRDFKQYSESALVLLKTMKTNSIDDIEVDDAVAFPDQLYKHASKQSREERLSFVAHVLDEIYALFEENQTHASWPENTVDDFLNIISQQANGVRRCAGKQTTNHHKKNHRKMSLYFKRLSRHVLEHMDYSADAWEFVREEVRIHLHKVHLLASS
ncbi:hypothetical protein NL108_002835 [Boleophthalmus pectinirostris]|uniref:interferon a3-like isoform X1 n=2 Tax=Boleophthalmus pectinirostris TaxID=150288 RepID=UPI00242D60C6|nr:interferon a3-like isoform X1 [Boleophthalmus pectinirostris]KAJ0060045.1 hypothetical protein NL108_002835 [Boleophthalmus pectinirostris]